MVALSPTALLNVGRMFGSLDPDHQPRHYFNLMRDQIILECTEARAEGKPPSRYFGTKNKKLQKERIELKKFNPFLRRYTVHREKK